MRSAEKNSQSAPAFTPGPWSVGGGTGFLNQIEIRPSIGCVYGAGDELKANARLIAASPDLYEALRNMHEAAELVLAGAEPHTLMAAYDSARAALAKAVQS